MIIKRVSGLFTPLLTTLAQMGKQRFWRQCQRVYTFQPIYRTSGELLAIELLTAVSHPKKPCTALSPEHYFLALSLQERLGVIGEQLALLQRWQRLFVCRSLFVSVNIDGQTLLAVQQCPKTQALIASLPFLRFELVEHGSMSLTSLPQEIAENPRLWLDDFGSGVANFSSFTDWRYEYIKMARELFVLLQQSEEGIRLFHILITLLNRYTQGVIVEGIETEQEWALVCQSGASAAQGYYLARPSIFDTLASVPSHVNTGK